MANPAKSSPTRRIALRARLARPSAVYLGISECAAYGAFVATARYRWPLDDDGRLRLTWAVDPAKAGGHGARLRDAMVEATEAWSRATDGRLIYAAQLPELADILVRIVEIDGAGGVLARNYFPPVAGSSALDIHGDMAIDTDTIATMADGGLVTVMTHELGHGLGLRHSAPGLMAPYYSGRSRQRPAAEDVDRLNAIYWPAARRQRRGWWPFARSRG